MEIRARRTLQLSEWYGDFHRLDVRIGRKILEDGAADGRRKAVAPGSADVVLTLGEREWRRWRCPRPG